MIKRVLLLFLLYPITFIVTAQQKDHLIIKGNKSTVITNPVNSTINIRNITNIDTRVNYDSLTNGFIRALIPVLSKMLNDKIDSFSSKALRQHLIDSVLEKRPEMKKIFTSEKAFTSSVGTMLTDSAFRQEPLSEATRDSLLIPVQVTNGYAVIRNRNKFGMINYSGQLILDYKYDNISYDGDTNCIAVARNNSGYYINTMEKTVLTVQGASLVFPFKDSIACVVINGKYGAINKSGQIQIQPIYDEIRDFYMGIAPFIKRTKYGGSFTGLIDKRGNVILPAQYHLETLPSEGGDNYYIFWLKKGKKGLSASTCDGWLILNRTGSVLIRSGKKPFAPMVRQNQKGFFIVTIGHNSIFKHEVYLFDSNGTVKLYLNNGAGLSFLSDSLLCLYSNPHYIKGVGWLHNSKIINLNGKVVLDGNYLSISVLTKDTYYVSILRDGAVVYGVVNQNGLDLIPAYFSFIRKLPSGGYTGRVSQTFLNIWTEKRKPISLPNKIILFDENFNCTENCNSLNILESQAK